MSALRLRSLGLFTLCVALAQTSTFAASFRHHRPYLSSNARPFVRTYMLRNEFLDRADDETSEDTTAVSLDPGQASLCRSLIGQIRVYGNPDPNLDIITNDSLISAGSQLGCSAAQNETTIAVNPENPANIVAGANDYRSFNSRAQRNESSGFAYASFDGGRTWTAAQLPHLTRLSGASGALSRMDAAGNPAVAFGPNNVVYYVSLVFSRSHDATAVVVSKSTNGGRTWGEPAIVRVDGADATGKSIETANFNDKGSIAVDRRSGAVYVTWTRFGPDDHGFDGSPIVASRSVDGGKTWSKFVPINPVSNFKREGITPFSQGSSPQVGLQGELFVAYEAAVCESLACSAPADHDAIVVAASLDGGRTFTNIEAAADFDFPENNDTRNNTLTGENFRVNSFPQTALDPVTGKLYVVWSDDRNGRYRADGESVETNGDVFIIGSFDGFNWSQPRQIGTPQDEALPAVAAFGGQVAVAFYTRHFDPKGIGLDVATVTAFDFFGLSGLARVPLRRVTSETANPQIQFSGVGAVTGNVLQGVFIGDYLAIALGNDGVLHPCWTDFRGKPGVTGPNQDIYTQAIRFDE